MERDEISQRTFLYINVYSRVRTSPEPSHLPLLITGAMASEKSKIMVFGATGYLGKYMVKASVSMGHPTFAYVRPIKPNADPSKLGQHKEFEALGVTIIQVLIFII